MKSVISKAAGAKADVLLQPNANITFGAHELLALATPGHTSGCMSLYTTSNGGMVFTGDTLLIRGCGRTDFQGGESERLQPPKAGNTTIQTASGLELYLEVCC